MILAKTLKNKAFTLIETLVAISIIMLAITGPFLIAESGLRASNESIEKTVAIYYAQDAIEQAINQRDNNLINSRNAFSGSFCDDIEGLGANNDLEGKYKFTRSISCSNLEDSSGAPDLDVISMKVKVVRGLKTIVEIDQLLFNYDN